MQLLLVSTLDSHKNAGLPPFITFAAKPEVTYSLKSNVSSVIPPKQKQGCCLRVAGFLNSSFQFFSILSWLEIAYPM